MPNSIAAALPRLRSLALLAFAILPLAACDSEAPEAEAITTLRSAAIVDDGCVTLFAGQSIDVGTVCVALDSTVDTSAACGTDSTGALVVTYATDSGWTLVETHLAVAEELSDIPLNNKGNPRIGAFDYQITGMTGATTQSFVVPLCELGMDGADEVCEPVTAQIAAHAVVTNGAGTQTETAWGDGEAFGAGSWSEHFSVDIECHECDDEEPVGDGDGEDKPANPLASLDDEFDGDLSGWAIHNPAAASVTLLEGALRIVPAAFTQWYGTDEAVHVHKSVSGNFAITTRMTVTDLAGGSAAAGDPYRVGGLLLRDPAGGPNTVHMGIGRMNDAWVSTVTKSTDDGQSTIGTTPWAGDTVAEMRLCRVGDDVQALIRMPGEAWTIIDSVVRPDLPSTLAAGPMAYAGSATADLQASAEWVRFRAVQSLADCMHE
jgi:hypothetical protein